MEPVFENERLRGGDAREVAGVVRDKDGADCQCVCGDHHIWVADLLPAGGELVPDVGVAVGRVAIPCENAHDVEDCRTPA